MDYNETLLKAYTNSDGYKVAKANFKHYRDILHNTVKMGQNVIL